LPTRPVCSTRFGCPQTDYLENPKMETTRQTCHAGDVAGHGGGTVASAVTVLGGDGVLRFRTEREGVMRRASEDSYIKGEIGSALGRAGLPPDHRIAAILDFHSGIVSTGRDFIVRCDGMSLDQKVAEMRKDARYFEQPGTKVDHRDMGKLRESFDDIVSGKTVVE